jgi:hypothetical protein
MESKRRIWLVVALPALGVVLALAPPGGPARAETAASGRSTSVAPAEPIASQSADAGDAPRPGGALLPSGNPPGRAATASASAVLPSGTGAPHRPSPCQEHIPEGKQRPKTTERFPEKGLSGHQVLLEVTVEHGEGERVLPAGVQLKSSDESARAVRAAGFVFPQVDGPAAPKVERATGSGSTTTRVTLPLVPLPAEPGRRELVLPALPIAMARASGEVITLCTAEHQILIEDPIANQPNPEPKGNPAPRRQRELWEGLKLTAYGSLIGLALALAFALLFRWWQRRPKKLPPPPPPRPAWELALEELEQLQRSQLLEQGHLEEHFDQVSHALRRYLGGRYGFDGLESTTTEIMEEMMRRVWRVGLQQDGTRESIIQFLEESDLVKFANVAPTAAQCRGMWDRAKQVVVDTMPSAGEPQRAQVSPAPETSAAGSSSKTTRSVDRATGPAPPEDDSDTSKPEANP